MRNGDNIAWVRGMLARCEGIISQLEAVPDQCAVMLQFFPERLPRVLLHWLLATALLPMMRVVRWSMKRRLAQLGGP